MTTRRPPTVLENKNARSADETVTIAIVEDDKVFRGTLTTMIDRAGGFRLVGAWASGEEALAKLHQLRPDIVLMDINLPGMSGIECTARLRQQSPSTHVLMLTVYQDNERIFKALQAGAGGYLLKRSTPALILQSIRDVLEGGAPMSGQIARLVVESFHRKPEPSGSEELSLTSREEEILKMASQGYVTKEIADLLGISLNTARTHLQRIYQKLHVRSRTEAVIKFLK